MKTYEIHISASYMVNGSKEWNCFKEYIEAKNTTEAKKIIRSELKSDGYKNITIMDCIKL